MPHWDVRPLSPFGAEISGFDLTGVTPEQATDVRALLDEHLVVVFRGHDSPLAHAELVAFAAAFGDLRASSANQSRLPDEPMINVVSNGEFEGAKGTGGANLVDWHGDIGFNPPFPLTEYIVLDALQLPEEGGDTLYCDLPTAYQQLPEEIKQRVRDATVEYSINPHLDYMQVSEEYLATLTPLRMPLVYRNPRTGRASISPNIGETHLVHMDGWSDDDALGVLQEIYDFVTQDEFIYRHHWQTGDIVMWSNLETMHRREPFPGDRQRVMRHVNVLQAA